MTRIQVIVEARTICSGCWARACQGAVMSRAQLEGALGDSQVAQQVDWAQFGGSVQIQCFWALKAYKDEGP